jgi:hypothetical protein
VDKLKNVGMSDKPRLEHFTSRLLTKPSTVLQLHPVGHAATPSFPSALGTLNNVAIVIIKGQKYIIGIC